MCKYVSKNPKATRESTRIIALILGGLCLAYGIYSLSVYSIVVGALVVLAMAMKKEIAVTQDGVQISYELFFIKRIDLWAFSDIREIHKELSPDGREMALHVMKEVMSRKLIFPVEIYKNVIDLALEKNPKIHVANVN